MIMNINANADPRCGQIQNQLMSDSQSEPNNIEMWTDGPPEYDPANYYGDRHNEPGITHLTANAFNSNMELMKTLIHEGAHAIGVTTDSEAAQLEELCLGLYD